MIGNRSEAVYDNDPNQRMRWEWRRGDVANSVTSVSVPLDARGAPGLHLVSVEQHRVVGSVVLHDRKTRVPVERAHRVGGRLVELYEDADCCEAGGGMLSVRAGRVVWRVRASDLAVIAGPTVFE